MEAQYTADITHAGACLGYWDALRGGVTTLGNDEFFPVAVARAAEKVGVRSLVANRIIGYGRKAPPSTIVQLGPTSSLMTVTSLIVACKRMSPS